MNTFEFWGYSDDTAIVVKNGNADDHNAFNKTVYGTLSDPDGNGVCIVWEYSPIPNGCWAIAITPMDEDNPIPDWFQAVNVSNSDGCRYSPTLVAIVPDNVRFEWGDKQ